MAEQIVWRGNPSQWKNFGAYLLWAVVAAAIICLSVVVSNAAEPNAARLGPFILCALIVPIFIVLARYLQTKNNVYELTSERLKTTQGVLNKVTESLELYRVKDIEMRQPFLRRLVGLEDVQINTSDMTTPVVVIAAVPHSIHLGDQLRNAVEAVRAQKGVREIDVE
jgi:uncharacterized membrane protein YdbT with pleckstrin-like domain